MPGPWPERPMPEAVPRFETPRNLERPSLGFQVVETCRMLGYEPMPWQVRAWDTQYEYTPVETPYGTCCKLWYREARITTPRQSAKTTSTLVRQVHRSLYSELNGWLNPADPVAFSVFTAQHASDARDKVINYWAPAIERKFPEGGVLRKVNRSNGKEGFTWANGSRMFTFPPNSVGGHGATVDLVDIDEAFAFTDNIAEQGARHAMITRLSPQIVIQSTAGTAESLYFKGKVDDGRRRVESGEDGHVYYLEYSISPGDDIDNPDHWWRWMPALGFTIDIENVKLEHDALDPDEFYRAYGNGWTGSSSQVIPAAKWASCYAPKTKREGKVWMALDVSPGKNGTGRSASIAIASFRGDDIHVELLCNAPGIGWVADKIGELTRKHRVQSLRYDATGPARLIIPDIKLKSMANLIETDSRAMVDACGRFHQAALDCTVHHRNQVQLTRAVEGAATRVLEDAWAWKRRTSTADISPLVACTLAHWDAVVNRDRGPIKMHTGG